VQDELSLSSVRWAVPWLPASAISLGDIEGMEPVAVGTGIAEVAVGAGEETPASAGGETGAAASRPPPASGVQSATVACAHTPAPQPALVHASPSSPAPEEQESTVHRFPSSQSASAAQQSGIVDRTQVPRSPHFACVHTRFPRQSASDRQQNVVGAYTHRRVVVSQRSDVQMAPSLQSRSASQQLEMRELLQVWVARPHTSTVQVSRSAQSASDLQHSSMGVAAHLPFALQTSFVQGSPSSQFVSTWQQAVCASCVQACVFGLHASVVHVSSSSHSESATQQAETFAKLQVPVGLSQIS
jgi:hypothetical protein